MGIAYTPWVAMDIMCARERDGFNHRAQSFISCCDHSFYFIVAFLFESFAECDDSKVKINEFFTIVANLGVYVMQKRKCIKVLICVYHSLRWCDVVCRNDIRIFTIIRQHCDKCVCTYDSAIHD